LIHKLWSGAVITTDNRADLPNSTIIQCRRRAAYYRLLRAPVMTSSPPGWYN